PDQVHLLWEPGIKADNANDKPVFWSLAELIRSIKTFTAREINKAEGSQGIIWEKEWHDRMIRSEADLQEKFEYIVRTPWDAEVAAPTEDYEWIWYEGSARVPRDQPDHLSGSSLGDATGAPQNAELSAQNVRATLRAKKLGFSDRQLAIASGRDEREVRSRRIANKII